MAYDPGDDTFRRLVIPRRMVRGCVLLRETEMLYSIGHLGGIEALYDVDTKQLVVTIEDAASANLDTLVSLQGLCQDYQEEIHFIGQYLASGNKWLSSFASKENLFWLLESDLIADHIKETIKEELNQRFKECLGYVYFLQADNGLVKIGQTKILDKRIEQLAVSLPYKLQLILTIKSEQYTRLESHLHELYAEHRANGEWFALTDEDLNYIKDIYGTCAYVEHEDLFYEGEATM